MLRLIASRGMDPGDVEPIELDDQLSVAARVFNEGKIISYDPTDLARGVTVAGNLRFWLLAGERLYLFGREENRDAFAANPDRFVREANQRWPQLEQGLAQ